MLLLILLISQKKFHTVVAEPGNTSKPVIPEILPEQITSRKSSGKGNYVQTEKGPYMYFDCRDKHGYPFVNLSEFGEVRNGLMMILEFLAHETL